MKINRMEVNYWLHDSKIQGKAQIYCNITVKGERVEIGSTGITIYRDHWNAAAQRITKHDHKAQFKNEQLAAQELQLMAIFTDLFRKEKAITAGKIKRLWKKGGDTTSLLTAFDMFLKDVKTNPDCSDGTWEAYDDCRKKLIDFLISEKALDLPTEDFDVPWLKKHRKWMKLIPVGDKIGHADSYIRKHSQTIKQVTRWAKANHLAEHNSLEGFKIPNAKYPDPIFLTDEEFDRLLKYRFNNKYKQEVADLFIIYCRTGFHYGDLKDFIDQYQTALQRGIDGKPWLIKERIKTEVTARVPQFKEVDAIVEKYGGWERLPVKSNKTMNDWLKIIAAELGFHPDLSTKAGRKTFTDWCYNTLGLTTEAVKVMLGRKSEKGLEVYGRPDERRVIAELKQSQAFQEELKKAS
ncbi:phage integrase SAM-like domain-containing protein [Spirosoma oryzicola]|uniref:phage integrase SAM-like domain-containing protein n=1 Tax=Spirosoma oryzicola TaxID=2898794 RepID=UPI001E6105E9|nr:phage integrase SAM-like domain-containing protein [Spirosoma oryzicola]UHG93360.1 site-specific integrase [Spirosoma oryzicola]